MKILYLATDAYGGKGGIAQYNRDLIEALANHSEVSEIIVLVRRMPEKYQERKVAKIRFVEVSSISVIRFIYCAFKERLNSHDLVISGHINLLPLATVISCLNNTRLVLLVFGIEVWQDIGRLRYLCMKRVNSVWSISHITKNRMLAKNPLNQAQFEILPNAIHLSDYEISQKPEALLNQYQLQDQKILMTLSRLNPSERYKGHDQIIEALPLLLKMSPNLKYLIVGDGDDRERLEKKVLDLGLQPSVLFIGYIKEDEKRHYLSLADAFVMPSKGEGFGFVFLEALACGIPVIGGDSDGGVEALLDGRMGALVDSDDRVKLIDAINAALHAPRRAYPDLEYFGWPNFIKRAQAALSNVLRE